MEAVIIILGLFAVLFILVISNIAATGQVKLGAMPWTARSTDGTPIETGTLVRVDRVEGVKAFVSPVRETANI